MTEEQILAEWNRLMDPKDFKGQIDSYRAVADTAMEIIFKEDKTKKGSSDRDADCLFQMTVLKCLSILKLVEEKISYTNGISKFTMKVYDPFGFQPIVRAQFEAFGHFNNNYIKYSTEDERQLKYFVWVMCGLMNRQKFDTLQSESVAKKAKEKQEIEDLEKKIKDNACYKTLTPKAQQRIFDMAERFDWKLTISGDNAIYIGWQQLVDNTGANDNLKNLYRYFSLSAHPTNVSVFQFRDAYEKGNEAADFLTLMALKLSKYFTSLLIADYCKYSPQAKIVFDQLPPVYQLLINSYNRMFRNDSYQVNDVWNKYGPILENIMEKAISAAKGKHKVRFDHVNKTATLSIVDANDETTILYDLNNQKLEGMQFPYGQLEYYPELFRLVEDDGKIGTYILEDTQKLTS